MSKISKSNIFKTPEILRIIWSNFSENWLKEINKIKEKLIHIMDRYEWVWVSPQNIIFNLDDNIDYYKKIILIRDFNNLDYFEILNPEYEILKDSSCSLLHEMCWSIETNDRLPFWVLNLVPNKIKITWYNSSFEKIEFVLTWDTQIKQEQISFLIHEINHINWKIISDGRIINEIANWNEYVFYKTKKIYEELIPSFIEFTWKKYVIHKINSKWLIYKCNNCIKTNSIENYILFHFDTEFDFELCKSSIDNKDGIYKIDICSECF
jgi:hypothetical protein